MDWLNYHHLYYFWLVAREGTVTKASEKLRLSPSTISSQIRNLEATLEVELFDRHGRRLTLSDAGKLAFGYADEIFKLGREFLDAARGRRVDRPLELRVGIADVVPKLVSEKLMEPVLTLDRPVKPIFHDGRPEQLLADLAVHNLDLVILDAPIGPNIDIRAYNHLLGECDVAFFAPPELADELEAGFPGSLDGAPLLLPLHTTTMRRALDGWLESQGVRPHIVAEFDDTGLMKVFGWRGAGAFPAPVVVAEEIERQYQVRRVGDAEGVRERFYAVTVNRRLYNPAVKAIAAAAKDKLFS